MTKWEYQIVSGPSQFELNQLGEAGWELVSVDTSGRYGSELYFKRPINSPLDRIAETLAKWAPDECAAMEPSTASDASKAIWNATVGKEIGHTLK